MRDYDTIAEATADLKSRGFIIDFKLENDSIQIEALNLNFNAKEYEIIEYYRLKGASDLENHTIVYAVETNMGFKGILVKTLKPFG